MIILYSYNVYSVHILAILHRILFSDINECLNPCACSPGADCKNLIGSYECSSRGIVLSPNVRVYVQILIKVECFTV